MLKYIKPKEFVFVILPFIALFLTHYLAQQIPQENIYEIRKSLNMTITSIGVFGAILLFVCSKGVKSRKIFAFIMLMVGFASATTLIALYLSGNPHLIEKRNASPFIMTYGNIYISFFLLYPIEVVRPGWLSLKRGFYFFLPLILLSVIYYIYTLATDGVYLQFGVHTLTQRIYTLDIWLRALMFVYPIICLFLMIKYQKEYEDWSENNYASSKDISINWLKYYIFNYLILVISYFWIMIADGTNVLIAHGFLFLMFFITFYYKVLFHENPYPEGYFKEENIDQEIQLFDIKQISNDDSDISCFEKKLPEYKAILDQWIITEKPHLRKDFKLIDLNEKIPLNRSYLSRLINEGYNETFNSFITKHRINESIKLLKDRDDLTISRIGDLSGFSSPSAFGRSFLKITGVSPSTFRANRAN